MSLDGTRDFPAIPALASDGPVDLGSAVLAPTGANVYYVRGNGTSVTEYSFDSPAVRGRLSASINKALSYCVANRGDVVVVLPGHAESSTSTSVFSNLVAGTTIIAGKGAGARPSVRLTGTTAQIAISVANVTISGLRLRLEGANGITKAVNITGADCTITGCDIETASGATAKATIAIEVGSGALRCSIVGNRFRGTATHNSTDVIKVVGATTPDDLLIANNDMQCSATAGNGLVHVTVAALRLMIRDNRMYNTHTASTACVALDNVASDGMVTGNIVATKNDGTANAQGIVIAGSSCLVVCAENYSVDEKAKSGVITPAVVAT